MFDLDGTVTGRFCLESMGESMGTVLFDSIKESNRTVPIDSNDSSVTKMHRWKVPLKVHGEKP